jgi:hypothetical protein
MPLDSQTGLFIQCPEDRRQKAGGRKQDSEARMKATARTFEDLAVSGLKTVPVEACSQAILNSDF